MPSLVVMFCKGYRAGYVDIDKPTASIARGSSFRTELIDIGGTAAAGNLIATDDEAFVILKAGIECWVTIGPDPTAVVGEGIHLFAQERIDCYLDDDDKVSVIEASTSITE